MSRESMNFLFAGDPMRICRYSKGSLIRHTFTGTFIALAVAKLETTLCLLNYAIGNDLDFDVLRFCERV